MTDRYGLGALPSPPDERDYPLAALYAGLGLEPPVALPMSFTTQPEPPILNQGTTPQCVAYSTAGLKQSQDFDDPTAGRWWDFDEARLFSAIGGTSEGAFLRSAMAYLLHTGYPVTGNANLASEHKVAAYYAVPISLTAIKQALASFGEIILGTRWSNSWFTPPTSGILPTPDYNVGGHAIRCRGWDDNKGLLLANTWGPGWGVNGECWLPYAYLSGHVFEAWKAVDEEVKPAPPVLFHWRVRHGATVRVYRYTSTGRIEKGWTSETWPWRDSSAPCTKPVYRLLWDGRPGATTVTVLAGQRYAGKAVQVAPPGTTVT